MKINTLKFNVLLLIVAAGFSSCAKIDSSALNSLIDDRDSSAINNPIDDGVSPTDLTPDKFRLIKILKYSNSTASRLAGETVYEYDPAGNMIRESLYEYYNDLSTKILWMYREYEYSGSKKTKMKIFDGEAGNPTLGSYYVYTYRGDLLVKEEIYDGRFNSLITSTGYEYDGKGNLIREDRYDHRYYGLLGSLKYVYDDQDRLITVLTTDGVLDYYPCEKYVYDDNGRVIKLEYHEYEGLASYTEKTYNGASELPDKELLYDKNGNQYRKLQHYYDEWGNLTETVINDECSMFKRKYNGKLLMEEILYWWHEYGYFGTGQMPENGMSRYEYEEF
ncbi:MAG: hypothetical protein LBE91_19095 [Tannerella sp.]|jgi:hypothetical protein|nr:hypothetical protein [Tannerella sp.]